MTRAACFRPRLQPRGTLKTTILSITWSEELLSVFCHQRPFILVDPAEVACQLAKRRERRGTTLTHLLDRTRVIGGVESAKAVHRVDHYSPSAQQRWPGTAAFESVSSVQCRVLSREPSVVRLSGSRMSWGCDSLDFFVVHWEIGASCKTTDVAPVVNIPLRTQLKTRNGRKLAHERDFYATRRRVCMIDQTKCSRN